MIDFLGSKAGAWAFRLLAMIVSFIFLTQVVGLAWDGDGDGFLAAIFVLMVLSGVLFLDFLRQGALILAPAPTELPRKHGPLPELSKGKAAQVRKLHRAMAGTGMFAPEIPPVELFYGPIAAQGQPVSSMEMMNVLAELSYWHPREDKARYTRHITWGSIPFDWRNPPEGREYLALWEDENLVVIEADAGVLELLLAADKRSEWSIIDEDLLQGLRIAGLVD